MQLMHKFRFVTVDATLVRSYYDTGVAGAAIDPALVARYYNMGRRCTITTSVLHYNHFLNFYFTKDSVTNGLVACNNVKSALYIFLLFKNLQLNMGSNLTQLSVTQFNPVFFDLFFF